MIQKSDRRGAQKDLGYVWGLIWGMSGASSEAYLGHVWGMSETTSEAYCQQWIKFAVLHASVMPLFVVVIFSNFSTFLNVHKFSLVQ